MMSFKKIVGIVLILILFAGCTTVASPTATPTLIPATIIPIQTPTKLFLPTETYTPESQIDLVTQNCVDILPSMPKDFVSKGIIPLEDFQTRNTAFLNLTNGAEGQIPNIDDGIVAYAVSPDQKTLAYKTYAQSGISLTLTDAINSHEHMIFSQQADYGLYYWLNNDELLLGKDGQQVIFNPYTREKYGYTIDDFPDFDTYNQYNIWVGFNPKATLAIYKNNGGNTSLLDIAQKRLLGEVRDAEQRAPIARWTLNGNQAAIVGAAQVGEHWVEAGDNIFSVSQDGQMAQLTHLAEHFGMSFGIYSLSWSPNSRYIAVWMWYSEVNNWQLAVLDMETKQVTDYCIETDPYASSGHALLKVSAPIWSPDGQQIIVEHRTDEGGYVVLLDITKDVAFLIAQNAVPLDWMAAP